MMNKNEYGSVILVNMNQDVSSNTSLKLVLKTELGEKTEITAGLTVPASDTTQDGILYKANNYIQYTTKDGDIDSAGVWQKQATATMTQTKVVVSDYRKFRVFE